MTDGPAVWPAPPAGGPAGWRASPAGGTAPPGHTGALYDAGARSAAYPPGAPQYGAPRPGPVPGSAPIGPVNAGGPSPGSAWWSDARSDPWRDPYAPSAVLVRLPEPAPMVAPDLTPQQRRVTFGQVLLISLLTALLAGGLGGALGYVAAVKSGVRGGTVLGAGSGAGNASGLAQRAPDSLAGVAKAVLPSVVTVRVDGSLGSSIGGGFIVSSDGYLITNDHVIDGLSGGDATIIFNDSTTAPAKLVGSDVESDIAVLKIDRTGLPAVTFGDSDAVAVGDPVLAIGAPLDLRNTVTFGIISATRRPLEIDDGSGSTRYYAAIQTDAAVNHGNSGGPLVDAAGHVIGIDSVIKSLSDSEQDSGNIGLAFAIPINQAERVAQEIITSGKVAHAVIGATVQQSYNAPDGGVLISSVAGDGPADQAGIRAGDVILTVGGAPLDVFGDLTALIRAYAPGTLVTVAYKRGDTHHSVQVKLAADSG